MFQYFKMAMAEAKKLKEQDKLKKRLLKKDMDYQFLEELIVKVNENPLLKIKVTLKDGTTIDLNVGTNKKKSIDYYEPYDDELEVK